MLLFVLCFSLTKGQVYTLETLGLSFYLNNYIVRGSARNFYEVTVNEDEGRSL